jgi:hypothetical protein
MAPARQAVRPKPACGTKRTAVLWLGEVEKLNFENQDQTYYDIKQ